MAGLVAALVDNALEVRSCGMIGVYLSKGSIQNSLGACLGGWRTADSVR
jgi:hypothetical protein